MCRSFGQWVGGAAALLLLGQPVTARAEPEACGGTANFPCAFQLREVSLQPVPNVFKFQARVSQAKLPVGEGVFNRVIVNLNRGDETLCREEFRDVRVVDSTINVEIGRNMSCEMDQVIAENHDLFFQVCLGGEDNCLRPVSLGSSPYAVKSTFASQAQEAHQSDVAGQAHYAHRVTADRDLFLTKELGTGYFDFFTPAEAPLLYTPADFEQYRNGGFLQWTPMDEQEPTLHIVGKDHQTDQVVPLGRLVLGADNTDTTGRLTVRSGGMQVNGSSSLTGNTTVRGQLKVDRPAGTGPQGLQVTGNSAVNGTLTVSEAIAVNPGGIDVTGASNFTGQVTAQEITVNSLRVLGEFAVPGEITLGGVSGDFSVANDLAVGNSMLVVGPIAVGEGLALNSGVNGDGGTALVHDPGDTLTINPGSVFSGGTLIDSNLNLNGTLSASSRVNARDLRLGYGINGSDHANAGLLEYRPSFQNDALTITGAGTSTTNRKVKLYDDVVVDESLTVGEELRAGNYASTPAVYLGLGGYNTTRNLGFALNAGDHTFAGHIAYRPSDFPGYLTIAGAGTSTTNRAIYLLDDVTVDEDLAVGGNVSVSGNVTVGGSSVCRANGTNCPGAAWPAGSYCILQRGGSCPAGFSSGFRYWDDEDNNNANSHGGVVPDGSYGGNTRLNFCCK
ncbi:MAG: hypothetical protein AB2A00_00475 [Myxococcota bacterium]